MRETPKRVVFVPFAVAVDVLIPTGEIVAVEDVDCVNARRDDSAEVASHRLMFRKIRARVFETLNHRCVARDVERELDVDDVVRPHGRKSLVVIRFVYREGETLSARKSFVADGHLVECFAVERHSERVGECVPVCKSKSFVNGNGNLRAVFARFSEISLSFVFADLKIESQRHGGSCDIAVFKVESKRAACGFAVVKACRRVNHKMSLAPNDRISEFGQDVLLLSVFVNASVGDFHNHSVLKESARNFGRQRFVGVNYRIFHFGRVELVCVHSVEYACDSVRKIKFEIGIEIRVVVVVNDFVGVDDVGQLAYILRAVARNESRQHDDAQNQNQNQTDFLSHLFHLMYAHERT